jgi:micrococcal nuclease
MYQYNARLIRVIDADTITADIDLGFNVWTKATIRLFGIDAWETRTRDLEEKNKGLIATERLVELLKSANNEFVLLSKGLDKYGRSLGIIYVGTSEDQVDVNQLLITEGHAIKYVP